jgi:hypothetical protein
MSDSLDEKIKHDDGRALHHLSPSLRFGSWSTTPDDEGLLPMAEVAIGGPAGALVSFVASGPREARDASRDRPLEGSAAHSGW